MILEFPRKAAGVVFKAVDVLLIVLEKARAVAHTVTVLYLHENRLMSGILE